MNILEIPLIVPAAMISISELDIIRSSHEDYIYIGSCSFAPSLTSHFYTNLTHDQLFHRNLVTSEYYLPISSRFQANNSMDGRDRKQTLLNSLNSLSMSPANKSVMVSKSEFSGDPIGCLDEDVGTSQSDLKAEYLTQPTEDSVHVFQLSYAITDPLMTLSYSKEVIQLHPFLPRQVTPLVTATFPCSGDEVMLIIGCTKGYICQYNLQHRNLQIVRHGLLSIDAISCHEVLSGTLVLLCSQDQTVAVLIPFEGYQQDDFIPPSQQPTDHSMDESSTANDINPLDDSVWTECSSESESHEKEVSFLPSEDLFDTTTLISSTDIIAPSRLQTDNFLEETAAGASERSSFFQESDIVPISNSAGQPFVINNQESSIHALHLLIIITMFVK